MSRQSFSHRIPLDHQTAVPRHFTNRVFLGCVVDKGYPSGPDHLTRRYLNSRKNGTRRKEMPNVSKELIERMKYLIPHSIVKHQIRLIACPERAENGNAATVIDSIPRKILRTHLPRLDDVLLSDTIARRVQEANASMKTTAQTNSALAADRGTASDRSTKSRPDRQLFVQVCTLVQDDLIGFRFPSWRAAKFAREIRPEWLIDDGKRIYEYCLENDLRPTFSRLSDAFVPGRSKLACGLIIRWQGTHFDNLLKLQQHPLFAYLWEPANRPAVESSNTNLHLSQLARQAEKAVATRESIAAACTDEFNRDMDEECANVAHPYITDALEKISEAAAAGRKSAVIFVGSQGRSAFNCFGEKLQAHRSDDYFSHYSDHKLLDRPKCWDGVIARGLCLWAQDQGLVVDIRICEPFPKITQLQLNVSWEAN
jgi:hypothetical protein